MKIKILLFAHLSEEAGFEQAVMELAEGSTVSVASQKIFSENLSRLSHLPVRYAVNEDFVSGETALREGDKLAFIPPVAGG